MDKQTIDSEIIKRAETWLNDNNIDEETKTTIKHLMENNPNELTESFYCDLEFGTGGLRGIMGVGTNRMNKYTVGKATQGLANYLQKCYPKEELNVAIAYDCRNNSRYFAEIASQTLSANGIQVFLFESLRPTPELSFAVRFLKCHSGIVITASHNPKEYNGYKVYWNDGAQLVPPHDNNVIDEVLKIKTIGEVNVNGNNMLIEMIGSTIDKAYLKAVKQHSLVPALVKKYSDLKIVYTPIHGSGITLLPDGLKNFGFKNITIVEEQAVPDGNFPTVVSPNPEEHSAMKMALDKARQINADIILATDPDADRIGVGVKNLQGEYVLLNGNQTAALLTYYLAKQWEKQGKITGNEFMVKTIVTSELLTDIAQKSGIEMFDVLTGFKWIAEIIRNLEGKKKFIGGGEESYGYMVGDFVRDKDSIISCCMFAECNVWALSQGKTVYEILIDMYVEYGFYKEKLINIVRQGISGQQEIKNMMKTYRENPPIEIAGSPIIEIRDYQLQISKNLKTGKEKKIKLPKSNVLQFFLKDGSKISVRPSGTEPKIKFYISVKENLKNKNEFSATDNLLDDKINEIAASLKLK